MIKLFARLFGGKVDSAIASGIASFVLYGIAQIAKLDPHLASMVNPDALAGFIGVAFFSGMNILTNKYHIQAMEDINTALQAGAAIEIKIPVKLGKVVK